MKTFKLLADCTFEAESIDDAFKKLEEHFRALQEEMPDDERILFATGDIGLYPLNGTHISPEVMKAADIIKNYHKIEYLSTTDGKWYPLHEYYPWIFRANEAIDPEAVLLDTGGEMNQAEFWLFKITGDRLFRNDPASGNWIDLTQIRIT